MEEVAFNSMYSMTPGQFNEVRILKNNSGPDHQNYEVLYHKGNE